MIKPEHKPVLYAGLILILLSVALLILPRKSDQEIVDKVYKERAHIDGTIDAGGCNYQISNLFFLKWVSSCEGGYFVTNSGYIILFP